VVQALSEASGCQQPFAVDAFRYYMLREMPTDSDTEFSLEGLETRYNGDLANDLGNLVHRTLSMMHRYFEGRVPDGVAVEDAVGDALLQVSRQVAEAFEAVDYPRGLQQAWSLIGLINRYYDEQAPWSLAKAGEYERAGRVLYAGLETIRTLCTLVEPAMPQVASEMARQLNLPAVPLWRDTEAVNRIPSGHTLQPSTPIFPRIPLR
jgi:methionyl-tRNA synthetase